MLITTPRVLIADDEQHMRILINIILEKLGYDVVAEAINGDETIKLFNQTSPDILMLDINMPFKTGLNVLDEIGKENLNSCVIMMTSLSDLETVENCLSLGAFGFIRKDTPVKQMMKLIKGTWEDYMNYDNDIKEIVLNGISEI